MIMLNPTEEHVKEEILGYITGDAVASIDHSGPRQVLYKVVNRHYRHPEAKEHAFLVRTEVVLVDDIPEEYKQAVHLLDHQQKLMKSLMDNKCREEHSDPKPLWPEKKTVNCAMTFTNKGCVGKEVW